MTALNYQQYGEWEWVRQPASTTQGSPLWTTRRRQQPVMQLVALALVTLLVCAPAAMSSNGGSKNPIALMHGIAATTYELTGLVSGTNKTLTSIRSNTKPLAELATTMEGISVSAKGMQEKSAELDKQLGGVGAAVSEARGSLEAVDAKLGETAAGMAGLKANVEGSLASTRAVVAEFSKIDRSIGAMKSGLQQTIALMSRSTPLTKAFSENKTRIAVAGGDGKKFGVPNLVPGNRVMSVVLPMIATMQNGGPIPARKDSAKASNPLVGTLLKAQVPDGVNTVAHIQTYDGFYGLPGQEYFINTPVAGF